MRVEPTTSAVTVQQPEVTSCNFTAPIATLGALRNPLEFLLHPNWTQILICCVRFHTVKDCCQCDRQPKFRTWA